MSEKPRGRPKSSDSEDKIRLTISLTKEEKKQIEEIAKEFGMTAPAFVKFSTFSQIKQQKA